MTSNDFAQRICLLINAGIVRIPECRVAQHRHAQQYHRRHYDIMIRTEMVVSWGSEGLFDVDR